MRTLSKIFKSEQSVSVKVFQQLRLQPSRHYTPLHYTTTTTTTKLQYIITLHYTTYTPLRSATLRYHTTLLYITLHYTTLRYTNYNYNYTTLHYAALHFTTPHFFHYDTIVLHVATLHYFQYVPHKAGGEVSKIANFMTLMGFIRQVI